MDSKIRKPNAKARTAILVLASIIAFTSGSVLASWYLYRFGILDDFRFFTSMQFNAALALFCGALCCIMVMHKWKRLALFFACTVAGISFLTLFQYLLGVDFGIDQLFLQQPHSLNSPYAGRMAPNTSLGFCFLGISLIIMAHKKRFSLRQLTLRVTAGITIAFACIEFLGWATGAESMGWIEFTQLEGRPTIELLLLSATVITYAWTHCKTYDGALPPLLPLPSTFAFLIATVVLWQALEDQERYQFQKANEAKAEQVKTTLDNFLQLRIQSLEHIAKRWEARGSTPKEEWEVDALSYIDAKSGLNVIEWADASFHVRWIAPWEGNEAAKDIDLMYDNSHADAIKQMKQQKKTSSSPVVKLVQGGKGFLVYVPLFPKGVFDGFIVGGFDIKTLFDGILTPEILKNYSIVVSDKNKDLYFRDETGDLEENLPGVETDFSFFNNHWRIKVQPRASLIKEYRSILPAFTLFYGIFLSVIIFFGIYFAQSTYFRSRDLEKAMRDLNKSKRKAEEATVAKSAFLANMSHEIRTPLNGVIGMTSLLTSTGLDEKQEKYVSCINLSGKMLLEVINDILDFSKIEAGELKLEAIPCNLHKVVEEVGELMQPKAEEKGLDFSIYFAPDVPTEVIADPTRIRQAITNLASNAVKFTEKGSVSVHVSCIKRLGEDQALIRFEVKDTGIGIPPEKKEYIFEKFSQQDVSTTRKFGGTGLGLAICKQLVEMMQGRIGCESTPMEGSTFWFEIPLTSVVPSEK
ncbi:MAG: Signal transduction histidine-protein kinase BarA [Chlamydiae bacterium]|nr:Signal transduction histidine-protein kinase BarA [Chlamydiota bacterium]